METNNIRKENDMFVSSLLNPDAKVSDLIENGINAENTGFMTPDVYKNSEFVQKQFSDADGNFNEEAFEKAYLNAAKLFDQLASISTYDDLNKIIAEYNPNDIYARSFGGNTYDPNYEVKKVLNPMRVSEGVTSLFEKGQNTMSMRELAQLSKIWDSEKQEWLDQTADERGLFGSLFGSPLVYATWDEDGEHFDKALGRTVHHHKGDWKTNDSGQFYTETIGDREAYDKQFVAVSDTLTKENSWLNKVDFFDSDGLSKSPVGTTFKMVAEIAPYMIPHFNVVWGGIMAAALLGQVMPTFAKMLEGIAVGDKETAFTKKLNVLENFGKKFTDSYSDDAQLSNWGYQKMANLVTDIFGQLYQMRAMASLSKLKTIGIKRAQQQSFINFADKFGTEYAKAAEKGLVPDTIEGMRNFWADIAGETPEIKALIDAQSNLSKSLSLGYMAVTSSADVYSDAIQGGYDRRMAGLAGIIATAGQYWIMQHDRMGDWFLDATTGYNGDINGKVMMEAMRPTYDIIGEGVDKIAKEVTTEGKLGALAKVYNAVVNKGLKNYWNILKNGGEEYWKRAIIEGTEEVTEEAVMDATKGMFDFLSWAGVGEHSDTASFGGWENVFSTSGLERYLMNAVGGAVGGALFTFQANVIEPKLNKAIGDKLDPETKASIDREIRNGHTDLLMEYADRMAKADNKVVAVPIQLDGDSASVQAGSTTMTRGELIAKYLKKYIQSREAIIEDNGIKLSDSQLLQKAIRDKALIPMIEDSEITKLILNDFNQLATDLAELQLSLDAETVETESKETKDKSGEKKTEEKPKNEEKVKELKEKIAEKKKWIQDFFNGEFDEKYLKISLAYLHKDIREGLLNMDKYSYTKAKYNVSYNEISDKNTPGLTKAQVDKEYAEWKKEAQPEQKFIKIAVPAFDEMEKDFSPVVKEYIDKYKSVRANVLKNVLSGENFLIGEQAKNAVWRKTLSRLSETLSEENKAGATINDIFQLDLDAVKSIVDDLLIGYDDYFTELGKLYDLDPKNVKEIFKDQLSAQLESYPIFNYSKSTLDNLIYLANLGFAEKIVSNLKGENNDIELTKEVINQKLQLLGFPMLGDDLNITSEQDLANAFALVVSPKSKPDVSVDLETTVLMKYLSEQEILDDEIVRTIKNYLYQLVLGKHKAIELVMSNMVLYDQVEKNGEWIEDTYQLAPTAEDFQLLDQKVYDGLNQNKSLKEIILDWLSNPTDGLFLVQHAEDPQALGLLQKDPLIAIKMSEEITKIFSNSLLDAYQKSTSKESRKNPIFEFFRKMNFEVSGIGESNLMQLLELESTHLSQLPSVSEYIRQGVTLEQIENFLKLLEMYRAVIIGMEDIPVSLGNPISYNAQLKRYREKWHKGEGAEKYSLIQTEDVLMIDQELNLLNNKLEFLKELISNNTESKRVENAKTKTLFQGELVKFIKTKGAELKVNGISIFPREDEINKYQSDEEKLGFIEHAAFVNFLTAIAKSNLSDAVKQVIEGLGFSGEDIIKDGFKSNGLNSKLTNISQSDLFFYLATILGTDQHNFLANYKRLMSEEWYSKVPFYALEYAMKMGYSFYKDNSGIHKEFLKLIFKDRTDLESDEAARIFFVDGISGAGKTTVVQSGIYYMMNPNERVFIVAPNQNQSEKLAANLTENIKRKRTEVLDKLSLLARLFTPEFISKLLADSKNPEAKDSLIKKVQIAGTSLAKYSISPNESQLRSDLKPEEIPSVIFIDEITHFNKAELMMLNFAAEKFGIKIFTSGDTLQRGAKIGQYSNSIGSLGTIATPRLMMSVRAGTVEKKDNTDQAKTKLITMQEIINEKGITDASLQEIRKMLSNAIFELKYYQDDSELHGDKIVEDLTSEDGKKDIERVIKALQKANSNLKEGQPKKKIGILAKLVKNADGELELEDRKFAKLLSDLGLDENDVTVYYSVDDFSKRAVQGSEEEYFIIKDLNFSADGKNLKDDLTSFYTYITRSVTGSLIQLPATIARRLNIINKQMPTTDSYEMPGLAQQTGLKTNRIADINKIIGENYTVDVEEEKDDPTPKAEEAAPAAEAPAMPGEQTLEHVNPNPQDEEEKEETEQEQTSGEAQMMNDKALSAEPVDQTVIGNNDAFATPDEGIWGHSFYEHLGLTLKPSKTSAGAEINHYYATSEGTSLDFDGLIPSSEYIPFNIRLGFSKFKKVVSLYPDTSSENFKLAMADKDILDFFYEVNPELTTHHDKTEDDIIARHNEIYDRLVTKGELQIDSHDYVFGKKFNPETDRTYGKGRDADKELKEGELLLLFGRRISTKDGKINQYVSMGVFAEDDKAMKHISAAPSYQTVKDKIKADLENPAIRLGVLRLADKKRIKPITGLSLYKVGVEYSETLYTLRQQGLEFDLRELGLVSGKDYKETGTSEFLEFMAEYEANGDESLKRKKLAQFYKPVSEGGFIRIDPVTKVKTLSIAGKYFLPCSFTRAEDRNFLRILILEPKEILFEEAVRGIKGIIRSKGDTQSAMVNLQKCRKLSPFSLTRFVISTLQHIGALDENGKDRIIEKTDGTKSSAVRLYLESTLAQMQKIKNWRNPDIQIIEDALEENDTFDADVLKKFLNKTTSFGIFFIDANIREHAEANGGGLYMFDLASVEPGTKPKKDLIYSESLDFGYTNFLVDSSIEIDGHKFLTSSLFRENNVNQYLLELNLTGFRLQMPTFGLIEDILADSTSVSNLPLTHLAIDRKAAAHAESAEDLTGKSWEELRKLFDPSKIKLETPTYIPDKDSGKTTPLTYRTTKSGKLIPSEYHVQNKWGWDIKEGDVVQLFNDSGDNYVVSRVDIKTHLVTFSTKNGEALTSKRKSTHMDNITKVVSRNVQNLHDALNYDYYKKGWKEAAKKKLKAAIEITLKLPVIESKVVSMDIFNTKKWKGDKYAYLLIPFREGLDYDSLDIMSTKDLWTVVDESRTKEILEETAQEELKRIQDSSDYAGVLVLHLSRDVYKSLYNLKNSKKDSDGKVIKSIEELIKDYFEEHKSLVGWTLDVVLFKDYKRPEKIEGLEIKYSGKSAEDILSIAEKFVADGFKIKSPEIKSSLLVANDKETLKARGFTGGPRGEFLFYPLESGEFVAVPKDRFFINNKIKCPYADPENPKLKVGDIFTRLAESTLNPYDHSPFTIIEIVEKSTESGDTLLFYKYKNANGDITEVSTMKIDTLLGATYIPGIYTPTVIIPPVAAATESAPENPTNPIAESTLGTGLSAESVEPEPAAEPEQTSTERLYYGFERYELDKDLQEYWDVSEFSDVYTYNQMYKSLLGFDKVVAKKLIKLSGLLAKRVESTMQYPYLFNDVKVLEMCSKLMRKYIDLADTGAEVQDLFPSEEYYNGTLAPDSEEFKADDIVYQKLKNVISIFLQSDNKVLRQQDADRLGRDRDMFVYELAFINPEDVIFRNENDEYPDICADIVSVYDLFEAPF